MNAIDAHRRARELLKYRRDMACFAWARVLEAYGLPLKVLFRYLVEALQSSLNSSMAELATEARMRIIERTPQVPHQFQFMQSAPMKVDKLRLWADAIYSKCGYDRAEAEATATQILIVILGSPPENHLEPETVADGLLEMVGLFSDAAGFAADELEKLKNGRPGCLEAYMNFESIGNNLKPSEFVSRFRIGDGKADYTDPLDLVTSKFAASTLNRHDFYPEINLRPANYLASRAMTNRYVEVGGEQGILEQLARARLEKLDSKISKLSLEQAADHEGKGMGEISKFLNRRQMVETEIMSEREYILNGIGNPASLDDVIEGDDSYGEVNRLVDIIEGTSDLDQAIASYNDAVGTLPEDLRPIFTRILKTGETPKEAAINLNYIWTDALERRLQRARIKITKYLS